MKLLEAAKESLPTSGGHINFFEDLEQVRSLAVFCVQSAKLNVERHNYGCAFN